MFCSGDIHPNSDNARALAMVAALTGLSLSALMVTALIRSFKLSSNQLRIAEYVQDERMNIKERMMAAKLIQMAYKRWQSRRREAHSHDVPVLAIGEKGVTETISHNSGMKLYHCLPVCAGGFSRPPSDEDVLRQAKAAREFRYYRFLKLMENSDQSSQQVNTETRMERMEELLLYMLESMTSQQAQIQQAVQFGQTTATQGDTVVDDLQTTEVDLTSHPIDTTSSFASQLAPAPYSRHFSQPSHYHPTTPAHDDAPLYRGSSLPSSSVHPHSVNADFSPHHAHHVTMPITPFHHDLPVQSPLHYRSTSQQPFIPHHSVHTTMSSDTVIDVEEFVQMAQSPVQQTPHYQTLQHILAQRQHNKKKK